MVSAVQRAWDVLETIPDPEIPVVSIRELGILREINERDGELEVVITPTYSGCPAMGQIEDDVRAALAASDLRARCGDAAGAGLDHRLDHRRRQSRNCWRSASRRRMRQPRRTSCASRARRRTSHRLCPARTAARPIPPRPRTSAPRLARRFTSASIALSLSITSSPTEALLHPHPWLRISTLWRSSASRPTLPVRPPSRCRCRRRCATASISGPASS